MSIEGVAAAAEVGKTTIYRRYDGKKELAAAALASVVDDAGPPPETENTRSDLIDLIDLLRRTQILFTTGPVFPMAGTFLVEERRNPELINLSRERVILPRKTQFEVVIQRGIRQGEVRPVADLDVAIETLVGAFYARHISGLPETPDWIESLIDVVWEGLAGSPL